MVLITINSVSFSCTPFLLLPRRNSIHFQNLKSKRKLRAMTKHTHTPAKDIMEQTKLPFVYVALAHTCAVGIWNMGVSMRLTNFCEECVRKPMNRTSCHFAPSRFRFAKWYLLCFRGISPKLIFIYTSVFFLSLHAHISVCWIFYKNNWFVNMTSFHLNAFCFSSRTHTHSGQKLCKRPYKHLCKHFVSKIKSSRPICAQMCAMGRMGREREKTS